MLRKFITITITNINLLLYDYSIIIAAYEIGIELTVELNELHMRAYCACLSLWNERAICLYKSPEAINLRAMYLDHDDGLARDKMHSRYSWLKIKILFDSINPRSISLHCKTNHHDDPSAHLFAHTQTRSLN